MSAEIFGLMVRGMLAASAAIIVVLLARVPVRRAFGARTAYAFWALVPSAALASFLPLRSVEVSSLATASAGATAHGGDAAGDAMSNLAVTSLGGVSLSGLLLAIWAAGILASSTILAVREYRFVTGLDLRQRGARGRLWRAAANDVGPALVGIFRPRIVLPPDFVQRFDRRERALVLAHERAHLAAWDAQINAIAACVQCLGWFNPLFHVARRLLRIDQELACDERVMRRHGADRRAYANTMLKTQFLKPPAPLAIHWPSRGQPLLRQRIAMLSRPAISKRRRNLGAALCGTCALAIGAATSAAQPPRVAAADSPDAHFWRDVARALDPAFCQRLEFLGCKEAATAIGDWPGRDEAARLGLHLVLALQNGDVEQARRFIGAGADVDFFLPGDGTPLVIAAQQRDYAIARLLLEAGADANRFAPGDGAPLALASAAGDFAIVELLVAHDADVNAHMTGDETPLVTAARNNRTSVARHLIEHGADVNLAVDVRTWRGVKRRSPLGEATREHHTEVVRLLREYGATP